MNNIRFSILCCIVILTIFSCSFLQGQNFQLGIQVGRNLSHSYISPALPSELASMPHPLFTYSGNLYVSRKINNRFHIALEPGLILKGNKYVNTDPRILVSSNERNYFQIPLLVEFYIHENLFFSFGPEYAHTFSFKSLIVAKDRDWEIAAMGGINYRLHNYFDIALRYNHGLTYINRYKLPKPQGNGTVVYKDFNRYLQFVVRFRLDFENED